MFEGCNKVGLTGELFNCGANLWSLAVQRRS